MKFKVIVIGAPGFAKELEALKKGDVYILVLCQQGWPHTEYFVEIVDEGRCLTCYSLEAAQSLAQVVQNNKRKWMKILKDQSAPKKSSKDNTIQEKDGGA